MQPLRAGDNTVYLKIDVPATTGQWRFDPGSAPGKYILKSFEVHATGNLFDQVERLEVDEGDGLVRTEADRLAKLLVARVAVVDDLLKQPLVQLPTQLHRTG